MTVRTTPANGITIAYETFGSPDGEPLLLVMGLATQMLGWDEGLCEQLVARGFFVVRFDNRDIGLSTHLDHAGAPDLAALLGGDVSSAAYRLEDMADDTAALIDALGLDSAHIAGASMGGMIAQSVAARHPSKVRSLTSIMSTPAHSIGGPTEAAMAALLRPAATTREEAIERAVDTYRVIGSPGYPIDEHRIRAVAAESYDRAFDPAGTARQLAAIWASGDRRAAVSGIRCPTLVIHGEDDPLVQIDGGRVTAEVIEDAELVTFSGMGHDLPRALWPQLVDLIGELAERADRVRHERTG
jgi:pimeloyl-ACP methyl ester carboxylesterase